MFKTLVKYVGATSAAALMAGGVALADPPAGPRANIDVAPRAAARADARADSRADVRENRADRRAHRAPGELGLRLGNAADRGLAIANLVNDSVFYNAGIRSGDYIVSVNGHRLSGPGDFDQYLYADPNQPVQIVVWRDGGDRTITIQPNALYVDSNANSNVYDNDLSWFGVEFDPQYANELYIRRVLPDSYAYRSGLRAGDVITTWNGERVRSPQDFAHVLHDAKPGRVAFDYTRASKTMQGNATLDRHQDYRAGYRGTNDRAAERDNRSSAPSNLNTPANPPIANPPANPGNERDNIPRLNPPANQHETTPTVNPPANPHEPIPTVTPQNVRESNPNANPPSGRSPPTVPERHEAPSGSNAPAPPAPSGNAPRGR